jgi:hypothetical protein
MWLMPCFETTKLKRLTQKNHPSSGFKISEHTCYRKAQTVEVAEFGEIAV